MPSPHPSARPERDPHDHDARHALLEDRGHAHGHARGQGPASSAQARRRLAWVLGLVLAYAAVELIGGFWTGSLALLSDALHMVSDSAALALSLLAGLLAARPAGKRKTFGNSRVEILAALANGVALAGVAVFISLHAVERALAPRAVAGEGLFAVALGGLVVNGIALVLLGHVREHSLNVRGAFLHVASDALASVGVCVAGAGIWAFGWLWLDPAVSLVVSVLVLGSAWQLIRDALDVLMETVPPHLDPEEIRGALLEVEGVRALHCLHVWTIGSGDVSLSSHLVVAPGPSPEALLERVRARLAERFGIEHTTIQIEVASGPEARPIGGCREACEPVAEPA